ncbi:hypothetical protein AX17_000146 [Amanita inopinata Kibby_2008]|nr:hypothetical protein AX17_000146 [Amanita inopinata Kibby_2008]
MCHFSVNSAKLVLKDKLLTEEVKIHGERDNWKTIALSIPGRTNKACRKRWLHSLSPSVKKTAWTPDEDRQLLRLYGQLGPKWSTIARDIPGRTDDACSKRYREALDPTLKKDEWTPEEDTKLMEVYARIGGKWGQVGQELRRSGLGCRNRWRLLERKKAHRAGQANPILQIPTTQISNYEASPSQDIPGLLFLTETTEESVLSQANWSSFYTPEQYAIPLGEPYHVPDELCIAAPAMEVQNAPFQFSSSSLSAALSDPLQLFRTPPAPSTPNLFEDRCDQDISSSSVSPASPNNDLFSTDEQRMLICGASTFSDSLELGRIFSQVGFNSPSVHNDQSLDINKLDVNNGATVSPLFSPQDMSQPSALPSQESPWKMPLTPFEAFGLSPCEYPHRLQHYNSFSCEDNTYDEFSSTTSTPIDFIASLSPTSSPSVASPVDLPADPHTAGSLLFSPTRRELSSDTQRRPRRMMTRRGLKPPGTTRLSASLALTSE